METKRVAVLIDAENMKPDYAEQILAAAASYGTVTAQEVYGSPTAIYVWAAPVLKYLMHPNVSVRTTKGKNTSDIGLAIGAMDVLLNKSADVIAIASSDSDFSILAARLRMAGLTAVGIGRVVSNPTWKLACSDFVTLVETEDGENIVPVSEESEEDGTETDESADDATAAPVNEKGKRRELVLQTILENIEKSDGMIQLPSLFSKLNYLDAYIIDKQESRYKKSSQYLTGVYGDQISIESIEGKDYVIRKKPEEIVPAAACEIEAEATEPMIPEQDGVLEALLESGIESSDAEQVKEIFQTEQSALVIYNRIRACFGNSKGSEYYHKGKEALRKTA